MTTTLKRRCAEIQDWTPIDEYHANRGATIEQRIKELKHDLRAQGFCLQSFFATEAAFLAVLFTFNLLSLCQKQVTPKQPYRQPETLRTTVFLAGALWGEARSRSRNRHLLANLALIRSALLNLLNAHYPEQSLPEIHEFFQSHPGCCLSPDSEIGVDGIAKRTDAQGFALTKPLSKEIPVRKRKALSAGPLKPDRRADFGIRVKFAFPMNPQNKRPWV